MKSIAIIGTDTVVGHALATELRGPCKVRTYAIRPASLPGIEPPNSIASQDPDRMLDGVEAVVYCGDASGSSWDDGFGNFLSDEKWLPVCLAAAERRDIPLTFLSSDAVFRGPWVFHDEAATLFDTSEVARRLRALEADTLSRPENLVVRTNVIGSSGNSDSFLDSVVDAILSGQTCSLKSSIWSSPLAASEFARMLAACLERSLTGVIHLSGAERVCPWSFGSELAAEMGSLRSQFVPDAVGQQRTERSLRCTRGREELGLRMPTLTQSLDEIVESLQIGMPELVAA